jgi:sucrose-6-phosphate hydrolase SacC (GH32 family)
MDDWSEASIAVLAKRAGWKSDGEFDPRPAFHFTPAEGWMNDPFVNSLLFLRPHTNTSRPKQAAATIS